MAERRSAIGWSVVLALLAVAASADRAWASATATMTVAGSEQQISGSWDSGNITVAFNGYNETVHYAQFSTPVSLASALAGTFSRDYTGQGLCAHASGATITFQLTNGGSFGKLEITGPTTSFQLSGSGWSSQVSEADSGTIALQVDGPQGWVTVAQTQYGEGSTPVTVAAGLAAHVTSGSPVNVTAVNDAIYLQSTATGTSVNYAYTLSTTTWDSSQFSQPSFMNPEASGNLEGGANQNTDSGVTVYNYSTSYAANNSVSSYTDSVMGTWTFSYDNLNRLSGATDNQPNNSDTNYCWSYDAFGNRTWQEGSNETFQSGSGGMAACSPQSGASVTTQWAQYPTSGAVSNQAMSTSNATGGVQYDAAGDITNDGSNQYLYDAEGRICASQSRVGNGDPAPIFGYVYDGGGDRVSKGIITKWSCDPSANGFSPAVSETDYIIDQSGHQVTEMASDPSGTMNWVHTNVWAGSSLLGTYDANGLHFYLNDWLGTRRAQTDASGVLEQTCASLPFGDGLSCSGSNQYSGSLQYPTEHHFTGKERDQESGNDYFGARYYASTMGRFLSPDPSGLYYANPANPQSLNLYNYGRNNPLINTDPTGLDCVYINNDSGKIEDFNSGDCDNSTTARANSEYYVDGTVNSVSFNSQDQVIGYGTTTGAEGDFNSFAGSTSPDAGPAAYSLNPYTGKMATGETVNVTASGSPGANTTSVSPTAIIPTSGYQPPSTIPVMQATYRTPTPQLKGDPACWGAPDAVSDIHSLERGVAQGTPQAESSEERVEGIGQSTTQGNKSLGSANAYGAFNAGFMIGDYGLSVVNCLQGH